MEVPLIAKSRRAQFVWCAATAQHKGDDIPMYILDRDEMVELPRFKKG